MQIENRSVSEIVPYDRNPRDISQTAVDKVAKSIEAFGWRQPIVVDEDNVILVGHTRLQAAIKLGQAKVPVHTAKGLTDAEKRAYRLADNRTNQEASWANDLLGVELLELSVADFDLDLTGFDTDELTRLLDGAMDASEDEDNIPDVPEFPVTVPGDMWLMDGHRVICGDATVSTDVERLLGGVVPHLMVTDPPYGVEYDPSWRNNVVGAPTLTPSERAMGIVHNDSNADWSEAYSLFPGDVAYIWHAGNKAHTVADSIVASGFDIRAQIIWAKNNIVIGRGHYHPKHEPCWYAVKAKGKGHWNGSRQQSTVWNIDKPMKSETGHSTQKPVECMRRPIENNSSQGQAVYDPFLGSGTTLIAAETTGRVCYGIELHPPYVDVIVNRWQDFTGRNATLWGDEAIADGEVRTFNEIKAERLKDGPA